MKTLACLPLIFGAIIGLTAGAVAAQNLSVPVPEPKLCDPFIESFDDETDEDEQLEETRTRNFDQETRVALTSEEQIMDALYEEQWNLATGEVIERNVLCLDEPSYVVHWAELVSRNDEGEIILLAEGPFSFKKDGSFEFVFEKRPYVGTWELTGTKMRLEAAWMNGGNAVVAPVEAVETPVVVEYADGSTDTYVEERYGVGWFRFQRIETAEKGAFKDCACPAPNQD